MSGKVRLALIGTILLVALVSGQLNKSPDNFLKQTQEKIPFQQIQQRKIEFGPPRQDQNNNLQQQNDDQDLHEFNQREPARIKQTMSPVKPSMKDGITVTFSEPATGHMRFESMISILDKVAYAIAKPATILNVIRFVTLALSSLIMSNFIFPSALFDKSKKRNKDRFNRYNPFNYVSRSDIENVIDLMAKNYDDTLNRAGLMERSSCRERSLCVLGDMVSCEFPSVVLTVGKFTQNHLPPIDHNKNKYTKALILGLNQTDCDHAYKLNEYECPSFRDYVRSYFQGGVRRRRDHRMWRKH